MKFRYLTNLRDLPNFLAQSLFRPLLLLLSRFSRRSMFSRCRDSEPWLQQVQCFGGKRLKRRRRYWRYGYGMVFWGDSVGSGIHYGILLQGYIYIVSFRCVNQSWGVCPNAVGTASESGQNCGCQGCEPRLSKSIYDLLCGYCSYPPSVEGWVISSMYSHKSLTKIQIILQLASAW